MKMISPGIIHAVVSTIMVTDMVHVGWTNKLPVVETSLPPEEAAESTKSGLQPLTLHV
jgi:hypothetical protein